MIITTKVSMDLQKPGFSPVIYAVQGDQNTRQLEMSLYSGGTAFQVPEGTVVSMRYAKPDGKKGYYDTMPDGTTAASVNGNVISMLLVPQMLTVPGAVAAQLELLQGTMTLGTFSLIVHVEGDPAAGVVESEDYVNWVQWMEQEFQERVQVLLKDGDLKGDPGPKGDPGENAVLTGYSVAYQESESGEEEPTGEWLERIPSVEQGNYLWTRTVYTFNTGEPVTQYSVARFGIDGSGAVSSVAGISPDAAGNVALDASHVKALPIGGGNMEGPINMNGQALSGLNAPVGDTEPVTKGYAEENFASKQFVEEYAAPPKAGFIYPLAASVIPDGFLLCDGAAYSRAEYPELFAAIGIMYGEGDGSTTFNVPNIVERVPAGAGENHPAGQMVGEETHTLTVDEMPEHNHEVSMNGTSSDSGYAAFKLTNNPSSNNAHTNNAGGSQPHNIMQPTTYIRGYIIATGKGSGVSVSDIVTGVQALPLEVKYGGTGAANAADARKNLEITPENIGALSMELLWKNASPTSNFAAQTLTFSTLGGDRITIDFEATTVDRMPYSVDIDFSNEAVTYKAFHVRFSESGAAFHIVTRPFTVNFANGTIAFGEGQQFVNNGGTNTSETSRNDRAIPVAVYVTKGVSA